MRMTLQRYVAGKEDTMRTALRVARLKKGLTQEDVAKAIGVTRAFYGMIETGTRNPTLELAKRIAIFFASDVETLFFDSECHGTMHAEQAATLSVART
ncbi:MAG: helix-turn-helix transcriptional regulator [Bacteroidota bacterium]